MHWYWEQDSPQLCSHIVDHCTDPRVNTAVTAVPVLKGTLPLTCVSVLFLQISQPDLRDLYQWLLGMKNHVWVLMWVIVLLQTVKPCSPVGDSAKCENESGCQWPSDHSGQSFTQWPAASKCIQCAVWIHFSVSRLKHPTEKCLQHKYKSMA